LKNISNRIRNYLKNQEFLHLSKNIANFSFYQFVNYLAPLVTIPYIVRIVGPEKFGIISLALAVNYYFRIISDYGFSITGVQYIAQNQNDANNRSKIITNIFIIQFVLIMISFLLLIIFINIYPGFSNYKNVFLYAFLIVPANVFLALWFYIGMEKMKYLNYINLISKLSYIFLIFLLIRESSDFSLVPLLNGISMMIAGIFSLLIIFKKFKTKIEFDNFSNLKELLVKDRPIFISNVFINLYRNSNVLILGLVANEAVVGIYSAGEKLIQVFQSIFTPITQVVFPYISRLKVTTPEKSLKTLTRLIIIMSILTLTIVLLLMTFSSRITDLVFGKDFESSAIVLRIASFVILFGTINYILGIIFMTNYSMKKEFSNSVIITGLTNVILCFTLSYYFLYKGAAIAIISSEFLLLILLIYNIHDNKEKWQYEGTK